MNSKIHAATGPLTTTSIKSIDVSVVRSSTGRRSFKSAFRVASAFPSLHPSEHEEPTNPAENKNRKSIHMVAIFQVHKQTYGRWPAKNGKPGGESFDLDLIDMSLPAEHAYRGTLPYRLSPEEKDKFWGKVERKNIQVAVHEIQTTQRGPVLRGAIISVSEK
jgi:hypothetical protein